jgi:hypothetical protein
VRETNTQPELFIVGKVTEEHCARLKQCLRDGWRTRSQLSKSLGWDERFIRAVARSAAPHIVRGPKGFNLATNIPVDDLIHCASIFEKQGNDMVSLALEWRKIAHARIA